jgi:antitoxin PrlF
LSEWIVTITSKGQITLPKAVREILGVSAGDRIAFRIDGDAATITRRQGVVQRTAGMMRSDRSYTTAEEMRAAAEEAIAEDALRRMNN